MILGRRKNPQLPLCLLMSLYTLYPEYTLFPACFFFFFSFLTSWNPCLKGSSLLLLSKVRKVPHTLGEPAAHEKVDQPQARSGGSRAPRVWPWAHHLLKAPALSFFQLIVLSLSSQDLSLSQNLLPDQSSHVSYTRGSCHTASPGSMCT